MQQNSQMEQKMIVPRHAAFHARAWTVDRVAMHASPTSGTTSFFTSNAEYLLDATFTFPRRQSKWTCTQGMLYGDQGLH